MANFNGSQPEIHDGRALDGDCPACGEPSYASRNGFPAVCDLCREHEHGLSVEPAICIAQWLAVLHAPSCGCVPITNRQ